MSVPLLAVQDLRFSYGKKEIFSELNFDLSTGSVTCLIGSNGCGKTTLIDCITGYLNANNGKIMIEGKDISLLNARELAKLKAYVPQHHDKHFPFTVLDIILMGRTAHLGFLSRPSGKDRDKVRKLMIRLNMLELIDRDYTELSGGETQMVLILRALIQESPLIIMDEPTSHLDFKNELILLEQIGELAQEHNRGILMSTHSPNQALFLENRGVDVQVIMMNDQGAILKGTPSEILTVENMASVYGIKAVQLYESKSSFSSLVPLEVIRR